MVAIELGKKLVKSLFDEEVEVVVKSKPAFHQEFRRQKGSSLVSSVKYFL